MYNNQSPVHGELTKKLIQELGNRGHRVLAASYPGYSEPSKHGRHEPDVISQDSTGLLHIFEVKTGEDLVTDHSHEQFHDFSNRTKNGRSVPFVILVPARFEQKLRAVLNNLGLLNRSNLSIWTG